MVVLSSVPSSVIFCLLNLSISESEILTYPTMSVDSSVSPCSSILLHLVWHCVVRHIHLKNYYIVLKRWPLCHFVMAFLNPDNFSYIEVSTVWPWCSHLSNGETVESTSMLLGRAEQRRSKGETEEGLEARGDKCWQLEKQPLIFFLYHGNKQV